MPKPSRTERVQPDIAGEFEWSWSEDSGKQGGTAGRRLVPGRAIPGAAVNYPNVQPQPSFPDLEQSVLARWESERTFVESIEQRDGSDEFVFYDGDRKSTRLNSSHT